MPVIGKHNLGKKLGMGSGEGGGEGHGNREQGRGGGKYGGGFLAKPSDRSEFWIKVRISCLRNLFRWLEILLIHE